MSKARLLLSKILPQTTKKFTQIYLPYLWHYATLYSWSWYNVMKYSQATWSDHRLSLDPDWVVDTVDNGRAQIVTAWDKAKGQKKYIFLGLWIKLYL